MSFTVTLIDLLKTGFVPALDDYPIFSEEYRKTLNDKIINHYMFREICCDAPDKFNFYLKRKMNEIMPYYNKMYEAECVKWNFLETDYQTEKNKEIINEEHLHNKTNAKNTAKIGKYNKENLINDKQNIETNADNNITAATTNTANITNNASAVNDLTETTNTESTRTDNLTENTTGNKTNNTASDITESETIDKGTIEIFSDMPQATATNTVTFNSDGSVDMSNQGYATTVKNIKDKTSTDKNSNTQTNTTESSTNETKNTGTQTTVLDSTAKNTGTVTNTSESNGTNNSNSNTNETQTKTENASITKTENGSNIEKINLSDIENELNKTDISTGRDIIRTISGRKNISPADLIIKYRESIVNIDMLIIKDLNKLFYEVYI